MDTSIENLSPPVDNIDTEIKEPEKEAPPKRRKYDTTTARNQKRINREIANRENEAQTENLKFIFNRLYNIDNKLNSIITGKRKFDHIEDEVTPKKKQMVEKPIEDNSWNIKGNLLNLAIAAAGTFTIKFVASYIRHYQRKTYDGDDIQFPSHTF